MPSASDLTLGGVGVQVVRILPDITGLDKQFDYRVRPGLVPGAAGELQLGDIVRVDLHGRRVRGWVVAVDPDDAALDRPLLDVALWSSRGPDTTLIELARWASVRWAAGRLRPFLVTASPPTNVRGALAPTAEAAARAPGATPPVVTLRLGPTVDPLPVVLERIANHRALVIHPSAGGARVLARRLAKAGRAVAWWPADWERAATGVDVVVGTRAAAWARVADLSCVVVLDEHDEALLEERAPTWHARDVVLERARLAGASCTLVSPAPTVTAAVAAGGVTAAQAAGDERESWAVLEVVDRHDEEPWKRSLVTSRLISELRDPGRRVVCVINTPGRARRLACRACRALLRCAACDAAVSQGDDEHLTCARCGTRRPPVCQACGSSALANVRPGVTRLREELEAAARRPVEAITASTADSAQTADVFVGTEAALHRLGRVDTVAFLDFDAELLAPRYRAEEQAMALLIRAARMVGGRRGGGRIIVQTHLPDHEVVRAVRHADLARLHSDIARRRAQLELPPFAALARVSGTGHDAYAAALAADDRVQVAPTAAGAMVRAADWMTLGHALVDTARPAGSRLRVEVDPAR